MEVTEVLEETVEYIRTSVCVTRAGVPYDPTADAVSFAFCPAAQADDPPDDITYHNGIWETISGVHYAKCLLGSGFTLSPGAYLVLLKIVDSPETPIKKAGWLKVL